LQEYEVFDNRVIGGIRIASRDVANLTFLWVIDKEMSLMPSLTLPPTGRHRPEVSKGLEKRVTRPNGKMRVATLEDQRLPKLDQITKSLAAELGRVRDKERQKIAEDLHDHIGQNLALAKMKLGALNSSLGHEHSALVAGISDLISHTIEDTRSLIHELHPEWRSEVSLKRALDWLAKQTQAKYGLPCLIEFGALPKPLKKDVQEVLFQAVRELLVNTVKHARASKVRIVGGCEKGWIRIRVIDDGRGFDPSKLFSPNPQTGGFGLMIIRARLGFLGGNLYIQSRAGAGTRAMIALPESETESIEE
jgi:signal transduction histidine kinase